MAELEITWINAVPAIISRLADPGPDEIVPRRDQVHPLGLGAPAGGDGRSIRGQHRYSGR